MAQLILRPNADIKADQTEVPGGTAFSCLDDVVTQPTVPDTTDYVTSSTTDQFTRCDFATAAIPGGDTVHTVRLWVYIRTTLPRPISVRLMNATGTIADRTIPSGTAAGWQALTVIVPSTQAQVDAFRADWAPDAGTGAAEVACWYIEVNTRADIFNVANAKFRANRDPESGLSVAAGYMRSDFGPTADLGAGVSLCFGGDGDWATAAGQQPLLGTNIYNPGAPRTNFINNVACIINGYNLDTATFTFFSGAGGTSYFAGTTMPDGTNVVRWPLKPYLRSGRLIVTGMLTQLVPLTVRGFWGAYCDNWNLNPTNPGLWTWTFMPIMPPTTSVHAFGELGFMDIADGFVYMASLESPAQKMSLYRLPAAQFQAVTDWRGGEWWTGSGWARDKSGVWLVDPAPMLLGRNKPRGNTFQTPFNPTTQNWNGGFMHRRSSDNKFQVTAIFDSPGVTPANIGYALTPGTSIAKLGSITNKYVVPDGENAFAYSAMCHPQLTFTGAVAGDQVWSYAVGVGDDSGTWGWNYGTRWVKALAVT